MISPRASSSLVIGKRHTESPAKTQRRQEQKGPDSLVRSGFFPLVLLCVLAPLREVFQPGRVSSCQTSRRSVHAVAPVWPSLCIVSESSAGFCSLGIKRLDSLQSV